MDPQREIPEYRLKEPSFFAPNLLPKGSTIRYDGEPGNHLEPLNEAAYLRLEAWYDYEVDELDPTTRKPTGNKLKPRLKFKPGDYVASDHSVAHVVALPEEQKPGGMGLAESLNTHKATDQRPPPAMESNRPVWRPDAPVEAAAPPAPGPAVDVLAVGSSPEDKYSPRVTK